MSTTLHYWLNYNLALAHVAEALISHAVLGSSAANQWQICLHRTAAKVSSGQQGSEVFKEGKIKSILMEEIQTTTDHLRGCWREFAPYGTDKTRDCVNECWEGFLGRLELRQLALFPQLCIKLLCWSEIVFNNIPYSFSMYNTVIKKKKTDSKQMSLNHIGKLNYPLFTGTDGN